MTEIKFTDTATLTGARITDAGYLVADVKCARTGIQSYHGSEMGLINAGMINVYRPESSVMDKVNSWPTYAGKPVTMGHPAEPVTADNWKAHAIGDIGEEIARDGESVRVSIKIMDAVAIQAIQDGTRQISMGYTTGLEMRDGVTTDGTEYQAVQTGPIKINHLAIVPQARGGESLRIGDADQWGAMPIHADNKEVVMTDKLQTVVLGDAAVNVTALDKATIDKFKADSAKALTDMEAAHAAEIAAKDALIATADAAKDAAEAKVLSDADLDKRVADRADLIATAKAIHADVKAEGLSDADIRKAAVVAKLGDAVADKAAAYIDARFDILSEDAAKADPFADAMKGRPVTKPTSLDDAYTARNADLADAWRNPQAKEA